MSEAGIVRVDKPEGPTSHDVVAAARRAFGERRIGHTGTLDPFATGLLLVCIGRTATRLAPLITDLPKRYHAVARLGEETTTDDCTGEVTLRNDGANIDGGRVAAALDAMKGQSMQTPPAFSAKKVEGRRAYVSARAGIEVDLAPVPITIHEVRVIDVRLPDVEFEVLCSAGTYVRAIARDLGRSLGIGGHLRALRRTAIGQHRVEGAVPLDQLGDDAAVSAAWMRPLDAVAHLPRVDIDADDLARITHGMSVPAPVGLDRGAAGAGLGASAESASGSVAAARIAVTHDGRLVAIAQVSEGDLLPKKVFA